MEFHKDEPLTPNGRLFLQPEFNHITTCAIGFKHPLNIQSIKTEFLNSYILKHPRMSSLFVIDEHGNEFWRRTQIDLDDHLIIHPPQNPGFELFETDEKLQEEYINAILSDFAVSCPLSTDKPLWELHFYVDLKCMVFRLHHALGDGISLMSLYLASCRRLDGTKFDGSVNVTKAAEIKKGVKSKSKSKSKYGIEGLWSMLKMIWWTILSVLDFIGRCSSLVKDTRTVLSGGDGVELWPRMAASAKFSLQDMKTVKAAIPGATINDVLFGVISSGFSKYLKIQSPHAIKEGLQITGIAMVNLRKKPGLQVASKLNHRVVCNTTFMFTNMVGPQEEMTLAGNPMTFIRSSSTSLPQAIIMHMMSYAGIANMQILVAKDIIPNPRFLANCFQDALVEMKNAALIYPTNK
ncbi:wax ester synthase/diacylglycerol acyltransferase 4-like isoform X2 [Spinacia oleracea]|uniref:Wax ester synthase/diacylglycerol acyltransferase 4-like isoform X2 n=1 Tax=Spinacia oleracea TaxID=3562 RepID=A0A9R0J2D9_SPIOL|nr:wax ester synthase/diacylglycerol acyltransferase 4-like isoform X2 [Spinacia oleracea]